MRGDKRKGRALGAGRGAFPWVAKLGVEERDKRQQVNKTKKRNTKARRPRESIEGVTNDALFGGRAQSAFSASVSERG